MSPNDREEQVKQQRAAVQTLRANYLKSVANPSMRVFQALFPSDAPARGPIWISRDVFPAPPEPDLHILLRDSIDALGPVDPSQPAPSPASSVPLEWLGSRPQAGPKEGESQLPEAEKYARLLAATRRPLVILYMYGGAFYVGSPVSSRPATAKLAALTGGRVASVKYRLAPQYPFPCALLDVLVAYLSLLSPAPGARHAPVAAAQIVLAGDSAGANLGLALIQVLLDQRRRGVHTVRFNGRAVPLTVPAGAAFLSPYIDYALALPSWAGNGHLDFLADVQHCHQPAGFGADNLWPATPARADVYAEPALWTHPLVCPALAPSWAGGPPMWLGVGEERLLDSVRVLGKKAKDDGVGIRVLVAEGMPHIFPFMLGKLPQARTCIEDWARACVDSGEGREFEEGAKLIRMPGDIVEKLNVKELTALTREDVLRMVRDAARKRKPWTGPHSTPGRI